MEVQDVKNRIDRIKQGDKEAFTWVVDQYKDLVYTLCVRMLTDEEDASDATQEVFLKAYRSIESFREKSRFSTWLYRIAYNHCISVIRKKVKIIDLAEDVEESDVDLSDADGLESLSREERNHYLQLALEALPETDSVVMTLFYYEELSLEEIAEITGLSSGNIRIKLHRSRKKMLLVLNELLKTEVKSLI